MVVEIFSPEAASAMRYSEHMMKEVARKTKDAAMMASGMPPGGGISFGGGGPGGQGGSPGSQDGGPGQAFRG